MNITYVEFDKNDNLIIKGINEKGKIDNIYIAIPPPNEKSRVDIINMRDFISGYNFRCEDDVIIIKVSKLGNKFLWVPDGIKYKKI